MLKNTEERNISSPGRMAIRDAEIEEYAESGFEVIYPSS